LATATDGTTNISYAYDASGLRTSKVVNGVTHNYLYASGQLMQETYGNNTLDFFYDASGHPYALKHNGTTYYYINNLQGDVMYLIDANENTVASYEYDPYGNIVSATGTMAEINPLRYRGYYYDAELEMYYLQSRYHDHQIGRFIKTNIPIT
jgi:RHS repeat-associated protein